MALRAYYLPLMQNALPEWVNLYRLADRGETLAGRFSVSAMHRLGRSLSSRSGDGTASLAFRRDDRGRALIEGEVEAGLAFTCQRCLEPVNLDVRGRIAVVIVEDVEKSGDDATIPAEFEPYENSGGNIDMLPLIEDELILAAPLVPMHVSVADCGSAADHVEAAPPEEERSAEQPASDNDNPFAVLKHLKK